MQIKQLLALIAFAGLATAATVPALAQTSEHVVATRDAGKFSMLLAKAGLAQAGVTDPTAEQLAAAVSAIDAQRTSGMGWGDIANALGLKLGPVVSAFRTDTQERADNRGSESMRLDGIQSDAGSKGESMGKSNASASSRSGGNSGGGSSSSNGNGNGSSGRSK